MGQSQPSKIASSAAETNSAPSSRTTLWRRKRSASPETFGQPAYRAKGTPCLRADEAATIALMFPYLRKLSKNGQRFSYPQLARMASALKISDLLPWRSPMIRKEKNRHG